MYRLFLVFSLALSLSSARAHVYEVPGDPTRYVVRGTCVLAIRPEGPLRARCAVIPPYERELTLEPATRPATLPALASTLGVPSSDLPPALIALWQTGDSAPASWHRLSQGYLEIRCLMRGFARVRRYPAPARELTIRPSSGLPQLLRVPGVRIDDIGTHLLHVDAGIPVDWSNPSGY